MRRQPKPLALNWKSEVHDRKHSAALTPEITIWVMADPAPEEIKASAFKRGYTIWLFSVMERKEFASLDEAKRYAEQRAWEVLTAAISRLR